MNSDAEGHRPESAVLLLTGRGRVGVAQRLRVKAHAEGLGLAVVAEVRFRRRRRGGLGQQLRAVLPPGTRVVVVEALRSLSKEPLAALLAVSEIREAGAVLLSASPSEAWVSDLGSLWSQLGGWLDTARTAHRREQALASMKRTRARGGRLGRPRRDLGDPATVFRLLASTGGSFTKAAEALRCGESTLRRFVIDHRAEAASATGRTH